MKEYAYKITHVRWNNKSEKVIVAVKANSEELSEELKGKTGAESVEVSFVFTKKQMIDLINKNSDVYTSVNEKKTTVRVTKDGNHLTTNPDRTISNNLDNLPQF